jgi:hypothetical protein
MALILRPTGRKGSGAEHNDYTVHCGNWVIGRLYEVQGSRPESRWVWSLHAVYGPMVRSARVPSFEEARVQCSASWEAWKNWAGLIERARRGPSRRRQATSGHAE